LRAEQTSTERILWERLRNRRFLGLKFRRQFPVEGFITDFYCHEEKLVLEVDGAVHAEPQQKARDENRDVVLHTLGFKVLRVTNEEVIDAMGEVLQRIAEAAKLFYRP